MGFIIDIFILCVLFLFTYLGYKRGFIKVVTHLLSFFIAIFVTLLFYKTLATQITNTTTLDEKINELILAKIQNTNFSENDSSDTFFIYFESLIIDSQNTTAEYISSSLTITIIDGFSFICLFIITKLVLLIFNFIFNFISKLPIIEQFDKSGGLIYGIIQGIFIIYLAFATIYLVLPLCDNMNILHYINDSYLGKFFYEDNLIIKFL